MKHRRDVEPEDSFDRDIPFLRAKRQCSRVATETVKAVPESSGHPKLSELGKTDRWRRWRRWEETPLKDMNPSSSYLSYLLPSSLSPLVLYSTKLGNLNFLTFH
jgi:hypothetical protein